MGSFTVLLCSGSPDFAQKVRPDRCPRGHTALASSGMSGGVRRQVGDRLQSWVERSTTIAGSRPCDVDEAWAALVGLAAAVPPGLSAEHQDVVRRVLDDAWARVLALLVPSADFHAWRDTSNGFADSRVARALAEIDRRYADSRFKLQTLARQLAVSPSHLTQLLKTATGRTFGAHVHARRIAQARALLVQTTLSVKEVASRVGYATTTQLDRHFKKGVRRLPSEYRALMRGGDDAARTTHLMTHPQK